MSEERPGVLQYIDKIKENIEGGELDSNFFAILEAKPFPDQISFLTENIFKNQDAGLALFEGKNEKLAKEHREKGNTAFVKDNFVGALNQYNKSIALGITSENLSLCYGNRSAVYFEIGQFHKCLENINMAKALQFPENLMAKLDKRAADAKRGLLLSETENMKFRCFDKLTKPASKDQPFLIDCLEGSDLNSLKKRAIRTKSALVAGDIISKEVRPFSKLLRPKLIFTHCSFCLTTNASMSMIPCKLCSTAMFCNDKCYESANDLFHQHECTIIGAISGMLTESMWLGVRTILTAISKCGSVKNFEEFLSAVFEKEENILGQIFERSENKKTANLSDLDRFKAIMNLPVNEAFSLEDCAGTAYALKLLKENTNLIDDKNVAFMATAIYKSMKIARDNALLLEQTYSMKGLSNRITFYGRALYPFACNLNLSCAPNILLLNHHQSMLGVVMHPIPAGGALFAGLTKLNHITGDRNFRQDLIQKHLGKTCDCIACSRDYRRMESLPILRNVAQPMVPNHLALAAFIDRKGDMILKQYNFLCDYLNKHPDLKYLSFQKAGAINQLIFTLGKMAHPHAIEMKLGQPLSGEVIY